MKKAFTLAEMMIVLVVIAIITSILLPAARNAMPNDKVLKFKKGYAVFTKAITELTNSDEYYLNGDLGTKVNGDLIDGSHEGDYQYFCHTLADVISAKKVNCTDHGQTNSAVASSITSENISKYNGDSVCQMIVNNNCNSFSAPATIVTVDGITFYEANSIATFGMPNYTNTGRMFNFDYISKRNFLTDSSNYKHFCMDIDDPCKGEAPFGIGLRVDGYIILSQRANEWLEKSINKKD